MLEKDSQTRSMNTFNSRATRKSSSRIYTGAGFHFWQGSTRAECELPGEIGQAWQRPRPYNDNGLLVRPAPIGTLKPCQ